MPQDSYRKMFKIVELIVGDAPIKTGLRMNSAAKGVLYFGLVGLLLAGGVVAVFEVARFADVSYPFAKDGTLAVYFAFGSPLVDIQESQYSKTLASPEGQGLPGRPTVVSLEVTIYSVQVQSGTDEETGWTTVSSETVTLDLMRPDGRVLLGSANIAEQNITMVRMHVASITATLQNSSGTFPSPTVTVPSGEFRIPVSAEIRGQLTTSITISPDPHTVHIVILPPDWKVLVRPTLLVAKQVSSPE